jgi:UDP-glucuronate 4-epimerase
MRVLVTGAAGFIGSALSARLLARGDQVLGFDNLNDYYDPTLKQARLARLSPQPGFSFVKASLEDRAALESAFSAFKPQRVVNLAAQAGVRYSLENPHAYIDSNIVGFTNILEACRHGGVEHLVYASSSSVYGANRKLPFSVQDPVDHPVSLYAATKKANELMAHTYSHLFALPTTGLRFFTVYGPWGRPDMALFLFTRKILAGEPIEVFNHGKHTRDFTYVDDIVEGVMRTLDRVPGPDPAVRSAQAHCGHVLGALPGLQHRQPPAGGAVALHRSHRRVPGAQGREDPVAAATRRRSGYLRRCRGACARHRLRPRHLGRAGRGSVRGLVSGLLPRLVVG